MSERAADTTLTAVGKRFFTFATPRIIAPIWLTAVVLRLLVGNWALSNLVAMAIVFAAQPFTEWILHVTVLHLKPHKVLGKTFDPITARKHRAHHAEPGDEYLRLIVMPALVVLVLASTVLPLGIATDKYLGLSLSVGMLTMLFVYEWTHFLIHSHYVPKSRMYRYIWRAHRLHHFKNEHFWFGITFHLGDWVFRTFPSKDAVPTSTTVRTLGVDATGLSS